MENIPLSPRVPQDSNAMENPSFFVTENEMETRVGSGEAQINEIGNGKARAPRDFQGFRRNDSMLNVTQSIAIFVDSAKKSFGDVKVLENVNMRVQEGTIYGLLGSSGCGKTTLISALVGLRKLDSGQILICGKPPGSKGSGVPGRLIGYMPQDIALNGEFTIREVCHFFGRLYGMTQSYVEDRVDQLIDILDLKRCKTYIKNMSGGQKRRASFLVALLHEPDILILDEPTVGVDPVLRASIWSHLRELVDKFGITVLITTHYIEEMRQADTVGIMRSGVIMAEGSPTNLMEAHNVTMLEEVVLQYCLKTESNEGARRRPNFRQRNAVCFDKGDSGTCSPALCNIQGIPNGTRGQNGIRNGPSTVMFGSKHLSAPPCGNSLTSDGIQTHWLNRLTALTLKNFVILLRNIGFLIFVFMCPAAVLCLYCYAIGSLPSGLGLGIINDEIRNCEVGKEILSTCNSTMLSCAFIEGLEESDIVDLKFYDDVKLALEAVDSRKIWGYVHFGSNFSRHIYDRTLGFKNSNETIDGAKITVRLDTTTVTAAENIKKLIFMTYRSFSQLLLRGCNIEITGRDLPISIDKPIYGVEDMRFRDFIAPGITCMFFATLATLTCGLAFLVEKTDGMIERTKVAGVTITEIMMSHFFPQFGIVIVQNFCSFTIMFVIFDIPQEGSIILAFCVVLLHGVSAIGLGFMASTIFDNEKNAILFAFTFMLPSFIVTGVIFSLDTLPPALASVGIVIPGGYPVESIRSILLRGWDMSYFSVYMGFISPPVYMIVYTIITIGILRIRN